MSAIAANYAVRICDLQDVAARMVLCALAWQAPDKAPHLAHMSSEQIRRNTGLKSINGVKDALRRLVVAGEVRMIKVGGRVHGFGRAANFELLGVKRWIDAGMQDEAEAWLAEVSAFDGKPSESDSLQYEKPSASDEKLSVSDSKPSASDEKPSASDTHIHRHNKTNKQSADAPAPATESPSLPISEKAAPKPKKAAAKFDPSTLPLPHGLGLAHAWADFAQHRREIRAALTPLAAKNIIADLASVNEQQAVEALRKSVKHGWRGVFIDPPADRPKVVPMPTQGQPAESALARSLAEQRRKFNAEAAA